MRPLAPLPSPLSERVARRAEGVCFREFTLSGEKPSSGASRHLVPQGEKGRSARDESDIARILAARTPFRFAW